MSFKKVLRQNIHLYQTNSKKIKNVKYTIQRSFLSKQNQKIKQSMCELEDNFSAIHEEFDLPHPSNSQYLHDKTNAASLWESCFLDMKETYQNRLLYDKASCEVCSISDAPYRCDDCHIMSVCKDCLNHIHSHVKLHCATKWDGSCYCDYSTDHLTVFGTGHAKGCTSRQERFLDIIDIHGRTHKNCHFAFCDCTAIATQLYSIGFWPNHPTDHLTTVFDNKLLDQAHALQLEAKSSLYGICSSYKWGTKRKWKSQTPFYRSLIRYGSFYEYKFLNDSILYCQDPAASCPACYANPTKIFIMDGNFAAVHKKSASKINTCSRYGDTIFSPSSFSEKALEYEPVDDGCLNFRAGEYVRSKESRQKLDVQGIFGVVCRHEFWKKMIDMPTGERYYYSATAIQEILMKEPDSVQIVFVYDIACKLKSYMQKREDLCDLLDRIVIVIDQFHSYGHKMECQLFQSIRSTNGVGLTCGRQLERQWPPIRRTAAQTKEMSLCNRRDYLTSLALNENFKRYLMIGYTMEKKLKYAAKVESECSSKISDLENSLKIKITSDLVFQWEDFERNRLTRGNSSNHQNSSSKRLSLLKKLQDFAMERQFILVTIKRYPVGQKINTRLNRQLHRLKSHRRDILCSLNQMGFNVSQKDIVDPESSVFQELEFDFSRTETICRTFRLEAIRLFQLYSRAKEETKLISQDIASAIAYFKFQINEVNCVTDDRLKAHLIPMSQAFFKQMELLEKCNLSFRDNVSDSEDSCSGNDITSTDLDSDTSSDS